jgi:hypothetical protein
MEERENLRTVYKELCSSYRAVDDFRGKLLGFLPLASGMGIFLLIYEKERLANVEKAFLPMGAFGILITLGLFIFEIYGIRRCTHLIIFGESLEKQMGVEGQFAHRPPGLRTSGQSAAGISRFVSEPLASGIIYSVVMAAWAFLTCLDPAKPLQDPHLAWIVSLVVFITAFGISQGFNYWLHNMDATAKRKELGLSVPNLQKDESKCQGASV